MQNIYRFIFGYIYKVTGHISESVRLLCLCLLCFVFSGLFFTGFIRSDFYTGRDMVIGSVLLILMTLLSIDKEPGRVRWNRWIYLSMVAFGTGMLLVGQLHPVGDGYVMYALDLMLIFPAFYYVRLNSDKDRQFFRMLASSIAVCGIVSFIYCWYKAVQGDLPVTEDLRFKAYLYHPNFLGLLGVLLVIAGTYLILGDRRLWVVIPASMAAGIGIAYALLSASRSAILAEAVCMIAFAVFAGKSVSIDKDRTAEIYRKLLLSAMIMAVVVAVGTKLDNVNMQAKQDTSGSGLETELVIAVSAEDGTAEQAETGSGDANVMDRPGISDGMYAFTSGRSEIWKVYIRNFSWLGKDIETIRDQFDGLPAYRAHNNIIDYTFRCGYIVGAFYIIFFVSVGITGLVILFSRKRTSPADYFLVAIIGAYSIQAMLEIATLPFTRCIPCIFFLTIFPLMGRPVEEDDHRDANEAL